MLFPSHRMPIFSHTHLGASSRRRFQISCGGDSGGTPDALQLDQASTFLLDPQTTQLPYWWFEEHTIRGWIPRELRPFCRTSSSVHLFLQLEEPRGPKESDTDSSNWPSDKDFRDIIVRRLCGTRQLSSEVVWCVD